MRDIHQQISQRIAYNNQGIAKQANKTRVEGPTFKRGDKVFLLRKNLRTKRPSRKLDNVRIGPFEVLEKIGAVNYKLKLLKKSWIHPVFYISLLEPAPENAELATEIDIEEENEYTVEEIVDLRKFGRQ